MNSRSPWRPNRRQQRARRRSPAGARSARGSPRSPGAAGRAPRGPTAASSTSRSSGTSGRRRTRSRRPTQSRPNAMRASASPSSERTRASAGRRERVTPSMSEDRMTSRYRPSRATMKLIIQIPCLNEEETLPVTLADLPREVDGFDERRVAGHRRRLDRPHGRGRARPRRRPHRPADQQQGPRLRLPGRARRRAQARRRRDRQHRRRQPVLRARHRASSSRRSSPATPTWSSATARCMTIEHFSALKKLLQRLGSWVVRQASQTDDARHDLRLPRLQPRGRAGHAGRLEVHLHAGDDHPGRQDDRRGRPRADPDEPEAARVAPVPVDVDVHPPQRRLDLPHLRDVRAAAGVPDRRGADRRRVAARVGPLLLLLRRRATAPATCSR